jgi:hypothetical protein
MKSTLLSAVILSTGLSGWSQQREDPARWSFNLNFSSSSFDQIATGGASVILKDRHAIGVGAGAADPFSQNLHSRPAAGLEYAYYFRDLGNKVFNPFVRASFDYHRIRYRGFFIFRAEDRRTDLHLFFGYVGTGVSMRFLKHFTGRIAVNYAVFDHITVVYTNLDHDIPKRVRESPARSFQRVGTSPFALRLGVSYLLRGTED